jgi:hypothetical protein
MPEESLQRKDRARQRLGKVVEHRRAELVDSVKEPKQFLVAEYDSGDLTWFYTANTLEDCERQINSNTSHDVAVFDLDSGREYRVEFLASIVR